MCGRFVGSEKIPVIAERFLAEPDLEAEAWSPTWNAAPTQRMPVVTQHAGRRRLSLMRWGWPQSWNPKGLHVNAIGETAGSKRSFAGAFQERRCIVPATAFYEWQPQGGKAKPLPWAFQVDGGLFGIAGLWQTIEVAGQSVPAFLLLTTEANAVVRPIHHRMAAILPRGAEGVWLDPGTPLATLDDLMVPLDQEIMIAHRVSTRVNGVRENDPTLLDDVKATT